MEGLCAIAILFGGVVKQTTASLKVGGVIGRTAGQPIVAKKRLGHGQLCDEYIRRIAIGHAARVIGHKGTHGRFPIGQRAARVIQIAPHRGNILRSCTRAIQTLQTKQWKRWTKMDFEI
jgi:molybdopterin synthase catalytic subunit